MTIRDFLRGESVWHQLVLHQPSASSSRRAHFLGLPGRFVAKTVLLSAGGRYVLAVLPATHRVDLPRLAEFLRVDDLRVACEEDLMRIFADCELGAIPPFGRLYGVPTVIDASLSGMCEIVVPGQARHEGIRIRYRDFETLERPVRSRFAVQAAPRSPRHPRRKAG
jgi:Ala-tRNA(Pro) deacylase